jgi:hypothetical protein
MLKKNRRLFVRNGLLFLFALVISGIDVVGQNSHLETSVSVDAALGLVRQMNTIATTFRFKSKTNTFPTEQQLMTGPDGLVSLKGQFKPGSSGYEWMSKVNFSSDEVLPGWKLDYYLAGSGKEYCLILTSKVITLATDEEVVIYEAVTPPETPKAASLKRAAEFPNSQPYNKFVGKPAS